MKMKNVLTKQTIAVSIIALLVGAAITFGVVYNTAASLMMLEDESRYSFEETLENFEAEVKAAGWSVMGSRDMKEVLAGHGHDVLDIRIYELCSSKYSAVILAEDDERIVSPLMPCRVSIYKKSDGKTYVTRMNSKLMARPFGGIINEVMQQAASDTEEIIAKIII
jgi:uncharacterized protein (DUF302 family)